jgi:hypothetical protein
VSLKTLFGELSHGGKPSRLKRPWQKINQFTMAQDEKIFADGFSFKRNENAPDFVVGRLSLKVDEAIAFIKENEKNGWVNLNIKTARSGNHYVELDTFDPKSRTEGTPSGAQASKPKPMAKAKTDDGDLPF